MKVADLLRQDHETVKGLITQLERLSSSDAEGRQRLLDEIAEELEIHSKAEEELFYPAVRKIDSEVVEHAKEEHEQITKALADVEGRDPAQADFTAKVAELKRTVLHHVSDEEGKIFLTAERLGAQELERLGAQFQERKHELKTSLLQRGIRAAKQAARKIA
ncbi:MAG: hypothetical protein AUH30_16615 [Candidatus Rokubacteria bacterium 13_1_40CM_68_15]|nr:MAG: hypothetical protein AUH30_16615 [Candidatus Rokubacteria bacterium 13_1_40CM_68_15]